MGRMHRQTGDLSLTCFGGVGEIGGNKLLLEANQTSLFLDFGMSFGAEGRYFEEYLQPRSNTKPLDLLQLGLLPELDGIYRRDVLRPDGFDGLSNPESASMWRTDIQSYEAAAAEDDWTPDAIFISHAHLDHVAYQPFLGDIPVIWSPTTETMVGAISDVGNLAGFDGEFLEIARREVDQYGGGYFPGTIKLEKSEPTPRTTRPTPHGTRISVGSDMELEPIDVGHSIPGAQAVLIETPTHQVVYTGDIRFHGWSGNDLGDYLQGLQPDVLICEGTRIEETNPDDEQQVQRDITAEIEAADGLVLVGFAWKDLERYETVKQAAHAAGRIPIFDPRLAYLKARLGDSVHEDDASVFVERSDSMLYSPGDYTRAKHKAGELPVDHWDSSEGRKDSIHLEEGLTAADINAAPENYVLQMDYYRFGNLLDLEVPDGSVFIRAQTEPFNEEMQLSEDRLTNWLARFNINTDQDHEPIQIHASGHAAGVEILEMIEKIQPDVLIPVHTESPDKFENPHGSIEKPTVGTTLTF